MSEYFEFANIHNRIITLTGPPPDAKPIQFGKNEKKYLPKYFTRYVPRYLRINDKQVKNKPVKNEVVQAAGNVQNRRAILEKRRQQKREKRQYLLNIKKEATSARSGSKKPDIGSLRRATKQRRIVGSTLARASESTNYYKQLISKVTVPVSNDIGVGILSYNRLHTIRRLLNSIQKHTDLSRVTVIVSDESTQPDVKNYLSTVKGITVLKNDNRIGIAGNANRLLQCLSRFTYKILLNDDVEVLRDGWAGFYVNAMKITKYHHFCMRQNGVYGAKDSEGTFKNIDGIKIQTINAKPHGAVMALDHVAFDKVGYFDEKFGVYGMEHVDWSQRVSRSGIQPRGYHDVVGSEKFFKIHGEASSTEERGKHLNRARGYFNDVSGNAGRIRVEQGDASKVPGVTYIVPFQSREQDRAACIRDVLLNIKAQRYPFIEIIFVEQDDVARVSCPEFASIRKVLVRGSSPKQPFTKALAFNYGFSLSTQNKIILHDADMLVHASYTSTMSRLLDNFEAAHVGKSVLYMDRPSTNRVHSEGKVNDSLRMDRSVSYFEGGSLAVRRDVFIKIGGFCESFVGYGNEDTEFFDRLSKNCEFCNERTIDLIHLHHGRTHGWISLHDKNKEIEKSLCSQNMSKRVRDRHNALISKYRNLS